VNPCADTLPLLNFIGVLLLIIIAMGMWLGYLLDLRDKLLQKQKTQRRHHDLHP